MPKKSPQISQESEADLNQIYLFDEPKAKAAIAPMPDTDKISIGVRNKELIEAWSEYLYTEEIPFEVEPGTAFQGSFSNKYKWQIVVGSQYADKLKPLDFDKKPQVSESEVAYAVGDTVKILYYYGLRHSYNGQIGQIKEIKKQINGSTFIRIQIGTYDTAVVHNFRWIKKVEEEGDARDV